MAKRPDLSHDDILDAQRVQQEEDAGWEADLAKAVSVDFNFCPFAKNHDGFLKSQKFYKFAFPIPLSFPPPLKKWKSLSTFNLFQGLAPGSSFLQAVDEMVNRELQQTGDASQDPVSFHFKFIGFPQGILPA